MNPCPCGNYGDGKDNCICPPTSVLKYRKKISGPLLDRIDIQINVPRETISIKNQGNYNNSENDSSLLAFKQIKNQINKAREIQIERLKKAKIYTNSEISFKNIDKYCIIDAKAENFLENAINSKNLSMRAYHKIKKLARTIADLEQSDKIQEHHIGEALSLRVNENLFSDLV